MQRPTFLSLLAAFVAFLLSLASCSRHSSSSRLMPELVQAESIMYDAPDSALRILQGIHPPRSQALQHATWALLMAEAKFKCYIKQSDSLVNIACDYFLKRDDAQRKALALYCKGGIAEDNDDTEEAQECWLQAAEEVDKTQDYGLGYRIYEGITNIHAYRRLTEYALESNRKALEYAQKSGIDAYIATSYMYAGRVYSVLSAEDNFADSLKQSIAYYQKCIALSEKTNDDRILSMALGELGGLYCAIGNYRGAIDLHNRSIGLTKGEAEKASNYFSLGKIYKELGQTDSAYYFSGLALKSPHIYTQCAAALSLYELAKEEKDVEGMAEYVDKILQCQDSISEWENSKTFIEMQEKYNEQKVLNEKNTLELRHSRQFRQVAVVIILLLCLIGVLVYVYQRKLFRKERLIQEQEQGLRVYSLRMQENEQQMARNRARMEVLSARIAEGEDAKEQLAEQEQNLRLLQEQNEALSRENSELQSRIDASAASLQGVRRELEAQSRLSDDVLRLTRREADLCMQLLERDPLLHRLTTAPTYLDDRSLNEMRDAVDRIFDGYTHRLHHRLPTLTDGDLTLCCLLKLRLSIRDLATVLGISYDSVCKRKTRLKERITEQLGPCADIPSLDIWLWEF
ncbi:MAG: hypothetical protein Q4D56_11430 [Bacteroides sp.]|nr:hypothetical protein [Bacteroides sp.]